VIRYIFFSFRYLKQLKINITGQIVFAETQTHRSIEKVGEERGIVCSHRDAYL
jgi:hypothetical protein